MVKLITIDIDGTLLNSYGEVSRENKRAIQKALDKNIDVVLTSGRMPKGILPIANEINSNNYLICGNGAAIYDIQKDKMIYSNYLSKKKVLEIIDLCEKNNIFYNIYTNNRILAKELNYNLLYYTYENTKKPREKRTRICLVKDMHSYILKYEEDDFLKITICDKDQTNFKNITKTLKRVKNIDVLDVSHISKKIIEFESKIYEITYYYTEITNKNVNKWTAIERLIKLLKINKNEVLSIGDNINDKEMIENAGIGVVTENGSPLMKDIADRVVASNNENGVADAINTYIP